MFKNLTRYIGYSVNNEGVVKSLQRIITYKNGKQCIHKERVLNGLKKNGYLYVGLSVLGKIKHEAIHRLVAECFIPNPENKPHINHKNGVKTDNRADNLEWCTRSENAIHSIHILGNIHPMTGKFKRAKRNCRCGKPFQPLKDNSTYCSRSCATKYQTRFDKTTLKQ